MAFGLTRTLLCVLLCALALATLGGCAVLGGEPSARVVGARTQALTLEGMSIELDMQVSNPMVVPIPLGDIGYAISSDGRSVASGQANLSGSVPSRGVRTVPVPVDIRFADLLAALSSVRPGSVVPYRVDLILAADVPGAGPISLPMSHAGEAPVPAPPTVEVLGVDWNERSLTRLDGTMRFRVTNPNAFGVDLRNARYDVTVGGASVADASIARAVRLAAGGADTVEVPIALSLSRVGAAIIAAASGGSDAFAVQGHATLGTKWGDLPLTFSQ